MTDSMKFGPEWLRNLSQDGCTQPTTTLAPRFQLAEHRYGREEMLALFDQVVKAPDLLSSIPSLYVEKTQEPLALQQMTEDETRHWNRGINSDAVLRISGKTPTSISGVLRGGRGGSIDRGRGRGRGGFHYSRNLSYEEQGDGVDSRGLRSGLDRDRGDGSTSSTSFPRNIRPFDRSQSTLNERSWGERNGSDMGDWNGSSSPRKEFGGGRGFMSDNWRRHRGGGEEEDGWRTATNSRSEKWVRSSSWREGDKDVNDMERGGTTRGQSWERVKNWDDHATSPPNHSHRRPWDEDNLPEWVNENPSESGGSFDASGAFHGGGGYSDGDEEEAENEETGGGGREGNENGVNVRHGSGNKLRESQSTRLSESSDPKSVLPDTHLTSRQLQRPMGNDTSTSETERKIGRNHDASETKMEIHHQPSNRHSGVPSLNDISQTSKVPSKSAAIADVSTRSTSDHKSQPLSAQSGSSGSDSSAAAKKISVSCDTLSKSRHQLSATINSGKADSTTNSLFAGNSAECVTNVIGNSRKDLLKAVESTVNTSNINGCVNNSLSVSDSLNVQKIDSSIIRQTISVGRQKSEDDMERMQEVADDLVAKLMDDEESQEKVLSSDTEKWFYRDPQGEVQGPFVSGEMAEWFRAGYFTVNLLVRRNCDERYSQLGDLIKLWGRIPFMPGPTFSPLKAGDSVSTIHPTMTQGMSTHTGLEQDAFLMQRYQYELLQRQFLLRQQAVAGKLAQNEHWSTLSPVEQQQLIMQQMISQPITPPQQPVDPGLNPFIQQMASHTQHKNPVMHLLSQLHQPKVPTTTVPDSQLSPSQTQTPVLDPLQQLIQQMGGLQQPSSSAQTVPGHHNLLHPQPISVPDKVTNKAENDPNPIQLLMRQLGNKTAAKPQMESVWGGNVTPGPAAAAAAAAVAASFTTPNWLGQMPAAPPGQLPLSSLWDLHGKDVKTEQQILEEQMRSEEERRREELRKQEETQRRTEEEEKKRKQLEEELRKKEVEKQRLEQQMQKLEEERKQEERRRKEEERKRQEEKRCLEEKLRQEQKLAEEAAERKRQQEEAKRLEEEAAAQKREEAARKKEEEKKRKEEEKLKKKRLEEERKREEDERQRLEEETARKKQQQEEEERRMEQQRRQTEALRRLQEQQQRSKAAPWSQQTPGTGSNLADIQRQEKEKKEREMREQQQLLLQIQQQELHLQSQGSESSGNANSGRSNSLQLKWAERKPVTANAVKSLAEIQAEEQEQLAKQQERERAERAQQQKEVVLPPSAGIWGTASQSLNWTSPGSNASVWGSTTPAAATNVAGFWDEVAPAAPKPGGKSAGGKTKSNPAVSNAGNNTAKASGSKTRSKKEEALVMKLFEQNVARGDEFTQWCSKALSGLQSSVDIPTFVGFLRDIESPYEVKDYVKLYLGEGKEVQEFAKQFLERRSKWKNAQKTGGSLDNDMHMSSPAVNPLNADFQEVKGKGKKAKKNKMFRVDNRILGFNVTAAQDRINVGDRDYGEM